jgi:hypothetical protein
MATPNSLRTYDLLRQAIEQQRAQQQNDDWNSPSLVPEQDPDGNQAPQGLLGRLRALLSEQSQYQPVTGTDGLQTQSLDPNFRQLSRVAVPAQAQSAAGAPDWPDDRSNSSFAPVETGASTNMRSNMGQSLEEVGSQNKRPTPVAAGFSQILRPFPVPPMGPVPPIPRPQLPDWWPKAEDLLKLYAQMRYGRAGSRKKKDDDDDYCYAREKTERDRCYDRLEEYPHWDFKQACLDRAAERRDKCVRNGGRPDLSEKKEWGPDDEEIWFNTER